MRLERVTISGFRCFGREALSASLSAGITALVGSNAAGKTALLMALARMFGVSRTQRTIQRSDFHLPPGADPDDRAPKALFVDVLISLPELLDDRATPETVAPSFRHMLIAQEGTAPVCRIRLEARWEDDGTVDGEVSQNLFWVDSLDPVPANDRKHPVPPSERGLIQLYYTPASRDAGAQVRATTGALAARLLRAIEWSAEARAGVDGATEALTRAFESESAIAAIGRALQARWSSLHDEDVDTKPRLSLVSRRFEEVVGKIAVVFEKGADGLERGLDALSDGQQSLFYFALAAAVFDMERQVATQRVEGFQPDRLRIPALSIFALEEPENHLSPYYLARILLQVRSMVEGGSSQAIVTSHSPAVLSRVDPREVRYCRGDRATGMSSVRAIELPSGEGEEAKFVRNAMLAYPELYFARFVLLVEGDSEQIVLPRLAEALNLLVDPAFVAIVPLGGRHVQHFWRLLAQLGIPYATLLDLDLGRAGGGYGRIKTAIVNLLAIGKDRPELLRLADGNVVSDEALDQMHTWGGQWLRSWIERLQGYGVYFSEPLDLDLAMLAAFPAAYDATIPLGGGPRLSVEDATEVVLGKGGPGIALYVGPDGVYPPRFPAYRYHFLTKSKPATHLAAMAHIRADTLAEGMPPVLANLLRHIVRATRRD